MLNIIHFINFTYGRPFIDLYQQLPENYWERLDVTLVFSFRGGYSSRGIRRFWHWVQQQQVQRQYQQQFSQSPFKVQVVSDVNAKGFIHSIPSESLGICSGFNQIFSKPLLSSFHQCLNFHPSLLPYYRGPVPSYWCLHNGEEYSGITLHEMTEKIDEGKILYQEEVVIEKGETEQSLDQKIGERGAKILLQFLKCQLEGIPFEVSVLDADKIYKKKKSYYSFPKK